MNQKRQKSVAAKNRLVVYGTLRSSRTTVAKAVAPQTEGGSEELASFLSLLVLCEGQLGGFLRD